MASAPYRTAPVTRFELRAGERVWLGLIAMVIMVVVLITFAAYGFFFVMISGPALLYLLSGGPRRIEVSSGEVVISYWLRRTRVIPTRTLQLQEMDDELVFIDDKDTFGIENALFEPGDAHRCAEAIGAVAPKLTNQS